MLLELTDFSVFTSTLICIFIVVLGGRLLRWVAWTQQKEYRVDRLILFLQTSEGRAELFRFPLLKDFSRVGLKRPKITLRSLVTLVFSVVVLMAIAIVVKIILMSGLEGVSNLVQLFIVFVVLYVVIPIVTIFLGVLPTAAFRMYTQYLLIKAKNRLVAQKPLIIGITGSYGKTATKMLLAQVLQKKFTVFTPPRSHNTIFSIAKSILSSYSNQEIAIIEYAAYTKGEISRLAKQLKPQIAILTGLAPQHLGLFGSIENIMFAKHELIDALPATGSVYIANKEAEKIATVSDNTNIDPEKIFLVWKNSQINARISTEGTLELEYKNKKVTTELVGLQYLDSVRTVWQVASDLGISESEITSALESFVPPENFTRIYTKNSVKILDDGGTANSAGFAAAIDLAGHIAAQQKILVTSGIVDLGVESAKIHRELAEKSKKICDEVWYVGESGKDEFKNIFTTKFEESEEKILEKLSAIPSKTLIILEGRMPVWFTKNL